MSDSATTRFFQDSFARADSTTVENNWTTTGAVQIVNQMMRQSGASSTATAYATIPVTTAASGMGQNMEVAAAIACDNDSSSRSGTLLLRHTGDTSTGDGYGITLTWASDVLTLKIRKVNGGTWSTLTSVAVTAEATLSSSSFDGVFQRLGGRIYDQDGVVVIEALFEDEEAPRLSYTDSVNPLWKMAGYTGVFFEDNDAGVNGHVFVSEFRIKSIGAFSEDILPEVPLYTFGQLKAKVKERCLRDSSSSMADSVFGDYLNEALKDLAATITCPWWWEDTYQFQVAASQESVAMPSKYSHIDDNAFETGNNRPVPIIRDREYRSTSRKIRLNVLGQPLGFRRVGVTPTGGIVLQPYPIPSSAVTYQITAWRRPATMVNDDDIPDLPEELQPGLIWAAVAAYTMLDSDRTHMVMADNRKKEWLAQANRIKNLVPNNGAPQTARSSFRLSSEMSRVFRQHA